MKTSYQKGFIVPAIIAVVVVILAAGAYVWHKNSTSSSKVIITSSQNETVSSTTGSTGGWKTYIDQVDGVSIEYPTDWIVYKNLVDGYASPIFCPSTMADSSGKRCNIAPPEEGPAVPIKLLQESGDVPSDQRFLGKDGSIVYGLYLGDEKYQNIFDHMVSSFKLVQSSINKTSWKTYSNSEYGFQIQYPLIGKKQDVQTPNDPGTFEFKDWNEQCGCFVGMFLVSVDTNRADLSLTDWIEKNIDNGSGLLMKNHNFVISKDGNKEIAKFVGNLPEGFDEPVMFNYIVRSSVTGYIYTIAIDGQSNDLDQYGLVDTYQYDRLADKLLSTFKLISDKSVKY